MKKTRFLSLLMAVLMLATVVFFSGCGKDEEAAASQNTSTREIIALNMYILTEDTTTEAAADKVEMAINRILLPNHKTMVNMNYLTADEYWEKVDAALAETDPSNRTSLTTTEAVVKGTEGKSFTDMIEFIFADSTTKIDLDKPQIDIFVMNDYDKYVDYANDGKLAGLNSLITYDSKILNKTIHPTFMSAAKVGTETYGIPTNAKMEAGGYTYLVFNEDLLKKYGYEVKDVRNFASVKFGEYLGKIKEGEPGVWPISGPVEMSGAEYYGDAFVTVSSQFNYIASGARPIFMYNGYLDNRTAVENYKNLGYYPAYDIKGAKYAIEVEQTKELLSNEEDKRWTDETGTTYVRYLYDIPRVEIQDAFNSVMCISKTSPVPERAMEIITLFQTNAELANLLQYGIEDEHYQVNQLDGTIAILTDEYAMDNIITGNTFIKHLHPDNPDKNYKENAIAANMNIAPSAFLGFNLNLPSAEMSKYELVRSANAAAAEMVENGEITFDEAKAIMRRENLYLGYDTDASGNVLGIYGKVQQAQVELSAPMEAGFGLGDEVKQYNEQFGIYLDKRPVVVVTEEAEGEEAEGETAEEAEGEEVAEEVAGETAEGDENTEANAEANAEASSEE